MTNEDLKARLRRNRPLPTLPHEAADAIERLEADNARLREALGDIANHPTGGVGCNPIGFVEAARAALQEKN